MNKNDIAVYKTTSEYFTSIESTYKTGKFYRPAAITSDEKCAYILDNNCNLILCEFISSETYSRKKPVNKAIVVGIIVAVIIIIIILCCIIFMCRQ